MLVSIRGFAEHYGRLLCATPRHVWRAADVISRLIFLALLGLFLIAGYNGHVPPMLVAGAAVLFVLAALAWTEYDRYTMLERKLAAYRKLQDGRIRFETLMEHVKQGRKLQKKIIKADDTDELVLRSDVAEWERKVRAFVTANFSRREAQVFDQPSSLPPPVEWKDQLVLHCLTLIAQLTDLGIADSRRTHDKATLGDL
jgi:hypothetical protein